MINIIIAEDQQLILKDLCNKISKIDSEINIVATATNGMDAYEKILKHRPDIVFTDIRMPILNGIDMIKKLKSENLSTRFVIISGYKDFEYAREAIKVNVDEYLLKPVVVDDIKRIFSSLKEKLTMKRQDYLQLTINKLINSTVDNTSINIDFNFLKYFVIVFVAGPYSSLTVDSPSPFSNTWSDIDIEKIGTSLIRGTDKFFVTEGKKSNEIIGVFATNDDSYNFIDKLSNNVVTLCNSREIPITVGISRDTKNISNIGVISQVVRTLINKNIIFTKPTILDCSKDTVHLHKLRNFISANIEKKLKIILLNNQRENFNKECALLIKQLEESNATQLEVSNCFKSILDIFNFSIVNENYVFDIGIELDECICSAKNYSELYNKLIVLFSKLIDAYYKYNEQLSKMDDIIAASKFYIENHFSEDINLNTISSLFSVSPTYFSKLFKKEVGIPPVVFLNKYRIKKACEYLTTTDFSVKEVAELCGYSDPFYFSKTFKNITGIPPKEYKIKQLIQS